MRTYASISPMFWTRGSGKRLRGDAAAQVVALYLMSSPATSMIGIFHVALPTLCHETGLTLQGARKGLQRCSEEGLAHWDESEELVFVPALAKHQMGESVNPNDKNKIKGIVRALAPYKGHKFRALFIDRYADVFCIPEEERQAPSEPLQRGPFLSCPDLVPDPEIASGPAVAPPTKTKRSGKTTIPPDFALTEKHLEHAKTKGYPEWWARNRYESFVEAAGAKGFTNANWDLALYGSWRREMTEWGNTPAKLAHLAPKPGNAAKPATDAAAEKTRLEAEFDAQRRRELHADQPANTDDAPDVAAAKAHVKKAIGGLF